MAQKIDYQKVNSLKAKWLDKLREMDKHHLAIQQLQEDVAELRNQVEEEEKKTKT